MDRETQDMLRQSLTQLLSAAGERPLSQRLLEFGWEESLGDDRATALRILFEVKGRLRSADDALDTTLCERLADALGDSEIAGATLLLPRSLRSDRPAATTSGGDWALDAVALRASGGDVLFFPVEGGLAAAKEAASLSRSELAGFDPDLGLTRLTGSLATADVSVHRGDTAIRAWESTVALARCLLSAELLGVARQVLDDAVAYTKTREQFGRPIGSFQALQHRMASAHAAIVGARHVIVEASETGSPWEALVAKALAGRAAEDACTQAQQAWGALGFTWEQDFHWSLRRTYALDRLFGDYRTLEYEIGAALQAKREVPRIGAFGSEP